MRIEEFRTRLQPHLDSFIAGKTRHLATYTEDTFLRSLLDYPGRLASGRGKRIRPYVAYLLFRSLREDNAGDEPDALDEAALRLMVSLELFHLFCVVHDDIIDRGTQRYGLPTIQRFTAGAMQGRERCRQCNHARRHECGCVEPERIGDAQAMLCGDLLFAWAHEVFNSGAGFSSGALDEARPYFSRMIDEVVIGQMLDVDLMSRNEAQSAVIQQKMVLKTASYTFIRPMQIGAALAGQSARHEEFCHDVGLALGIAFQTQDDLLDIIGTPQQTQKTQFADLREGQHTPFTQYIFECGTSAEREQLRALMGADLGPDDRERVLQLFEGSGAIAHGQARVERHLQQAEHLIESGPLHRRERDGLCHLIALIRGRAAK